MPFQLYEISSSDTENHQLANTAVQFKHISPLQTDSPFSNIAIPIASASDGEIA